ncbi:MAG: outer membrane beta-barrel protein [Nitrospira sp.]|nr:outer membrane beta-barrel protein [Nitrospira sp.]
MTRVIDRISNRRWCVAIAAAAGGVALCLGIAALPADAEAAGLGESYRSGRWEIMLSPQYTFERNLKLEGGTTANIDDTVGFGFQLGYNFNEHVNLGGMFSWSRPDYQAVIQPSPANSSPPSTQTGTVESGTFGLVGTYHVLKSPLTPYMDANVSGTYIVTDIADGPPVGGCFWDPWFGYVCGVSQPTKNGVFLSYGVGGGLRWDATDVLLLRAGVRQQWIDFSSSGPTGFTTFKFDIGMIF